MKRWFVLSLAVIMLLSMAACRPKEDAAPSTRGSVSVQTPSPSQSNPAPTQGDGTSEPPVTVPPTTGTPATQVTNPPATVPPATTHTHSWIAATCIAPKTCSTCKVTEGSAKGHNWADATCTEPKTCSTCKATDGEANGHKWTIATCTDPKTCSDCKATEGIAKDHSWIAATCVSAKKCSICGTKEGNALGHNFVDGVCFCGETNYLNPKTIQLIDTVWYGKYYIHEDKGDEEYPLDIFEIHIPMIRFCEDSIEIGDEYYTDEPIGNNPYREFIRYTTYNGVRYYYQGTGVGLGYYYELTDKEILIYTYDSDNERVQMKLMVMKDGSIVITENNDNFFFGHSQEIGAMTTDREAVCGLNLIEEKNPFYIEPTDD